MMFGPLQMSIEPSLPSRTGHFRLESGYHTDVWITLDALFADPQGMAEPVARLAEQLRRYDVGAVCGPFVGGAFLALLLAQRLGAKFVFAQPSGLPDAGELFGVRYQLTPELRRTIAGLRVAVVDDMISAGSSARATIDAVHDAGATVAVVGCLTLLGTTASEHFKKVGLRLVSLNAKPLTLWRPSDCPLCTSNVPLEATLSS